MDAPPRIDETARLEALARLGILDTAPEERFDRITRLASRLLDTPIALVSLVDHHRQWFKSVVGLDVRETPCEVAFCDHAVTGAADTLVVPDATQDDRFRDNPLVTGDPNIRFYAGHVIHDLGGHPIGTLCVIDRHPHWPDADELAVLTDLSAMVEAELARTDEIDLLLRRDDDHRVTRSLLDALDEGLIMAGGDGRLVQWNRRAEEMLGLSAGDLLDRTVDDDRWGVVHTDETPWEPSRLPAAVAMRTGVEIRDQTIGISRNGERRWLRAQSRPILDGEGDVASVAIAFSDITDDLEMQANSAALTERLRAAIDDSPLGTALIDALGRFSYVNDAYAEVLGRPAGEMVGRSSIEQIHPDDVGVGADEIAALAEGRRHELRLELRVLDAAGCAKHVRTHTTRLDPPTPDAAYLIQVEDVTAKHELTLALHRSEEIARTSLESLDQGVMLVDAGARVHLMNPAAERILGTDRAGITARLLSERPTTTYEDGLPVPVGERAVDQALATGRPVRDRIIRWGRDDGTHVLLRLAALPTGLDDQEGTAVIAVTDITEQRALEAKLQRYGILFEHANDIITVVGADGHVRDASPSTSRVLGYGDDWHHPEGVLGLVHPDDLPDARAELAALMHDDREPRDPFTVRVRAADGEWHHLECVGVNLLDEPTVGGLVLTSRDVTERQRLVDQLAHRATHDLLTELPNRTVLNDHLAAALARVERANRHVGLCYLDLDGFKAVNDTFGHAAGDALLLEMADRLRASVRTGDTPARVGGDEFVVILDPVTGDDDAEQVATRIRDAVLADGGLHVGDVRCGVSIGIATSRHGDEPDDLVARADSALYRSKSRGDCSVEIARG